MMSQAASLGRLLGGMPPDSVFTKLASKLHIDPVLIKQAYLQKKSDMTDDLFRGLARPGMPFGENYEPMLPDTVGTSGYPALDHSLRRLISPRQRRAIDAYNNTEPPVMPPWLHGPSSGMNEVSPTEAISSVPAAGAAAQGVTGNAPTAETNPLAGMTPSIAGGAAKKPSSGGGGVAKGPPVPWAPLGGAGPAAAGDAAKAAPFAPPGAPGMGSKPKPFVPPGTPGLKAAPAAAGEAAQAAIKAPWYKPSLGRVARYGGAALAGAALLPLIQHIITPGTPNDPEMDRLKQVAAINASHRNYMNMLQAAHSPGLGHPNPYL